MKSYFAKLAARATLPNAPPAPSRAMPMDDPFENVSVGDLPASTENVSLSEGPKNQSSEPRRAQSAVSTDESLISRPRDREVTVKTDSYTQPLTPRTPNASMDEHVPERVRETEPRDHERSQQPTVVKLEPSQSARPKVTPDETSTPDTSAIAAEPREPVTSHPADQSVNDTNAEQTISLKKADEFMKALFARRTAPPAAESKDTERPVPAVKPVAPRESTSRLQPAAKPRQPPEPPPEQPSLVIGKLTVEVVPPPSPPVTPRREVVVVRAGSSSRSASIPSSQRFGLGQF